MNPFINQPFRKLDFEIAFLYFISFISLLLGIISHSDKAIGEFENPGALSS